MSAKANVNPTLTGDDIERLLKDLPTGRKTKRQQLLTVGFTIRDCAQLIGETLDDRGVLGWFVHMPPAAEKASQNLRLSRLVIRRQNGVPRLGMDPILGKQGRPVVDFKLWVQNAEPDFPDDNSIDDNFASTYAESVQYTNGQLFDAPSARVSDLTHYTNWSGANFFRRSDLKFMQLLLLARPDRHNDLFFSGAKVRYDVMHNAGLRVEQFSRKDADGVLIPDPGNAFTLKTEPVTNPDPTVPTGNAMVDLLRATTDTDHSLQGTTTGNERFAGAAMATPCPPFWDIVQEIGTNLNLNSEEAMIELARLEEQIENIVIDTDVSGATVSLGEVIRAEDRGFAYNVLTAIINFLTDWRDGRLF